jgi:hypothetical protein
MPARDSLHYQLILTDDLAPGGILGALLNGFERSQRGLERPSGEPDMFDAVPNPIGMFGVTGTPYDESGDGLRQYFARHMRMTLAYYVDPRMTALVTAAAETMPNETLRPEDLPSSHGFLLLPAGLSEVDLRGQLMVHNVVCWFQYGNGVDLWFMSNKFEERDMLNQRHRRYFGEKDFATFPTLAPAVYTRIEYGEGVPMSLSGTKVLPPEITEAMQVMSDPKTGSLAFAWPEGYDMNEWIGEHMEVSPSAVVIWIIAMWRLMQQTITDVRTEAVDRPLRKAARKRNMKSDEVSVIALRKRKYIDGEGESNIEWSHRWLVRGHWRKQPCKTNGEPDTRVIWIHPHIKGPEDKPLLVRDRVYSLER